MTTLVNTQPADYTTPVVSLEMAKANSNIQYTDQDDLLNLYLEASIEDAEQYTGIVIQQRSTVIQLSGWAQFVDLPVKPLTTVTSIAYVDEDGNEQTLTANDDFEILGNGETIYFKVAGFPVLQADNDYPITVTGSVGYTDATVPRAIRHAILLRFSHKELYREDAPKTGADRSFLAALRPFKVWGHANSI